MRTLVRIRRGIESALAKLDPRWTKHAVRLLHWGVPAGLLIYLAWRISQIGWGQVWDARPANIGFYAAVLLQFYVQPLADLAIYRNLLRAGGKIPLTVQLRKRYINTFLDYSGELYFFFWARKHLRLKTTLLFHAVKDSNVLSASAGLVMVWMTIIAVAVSGGLKLPHLTASGLWTFLSLGSLPLALALAIFFGGRRATMLSRRQIASTFGIHVARSVTQLSLDLVVWWLSGALPSVVACLQFVALRVLVTRLPLIPNKDLVFVGVGIAAAGVLQVSEPKVAAALVIMSALGLVQNLVFVGLPWFLEQFQIRRGARVLAS